MEAGGWVSQYLSVCTVFTLRSLDSTIWSGRKFGQKDLKQVQMFQLVNRARWFERNFSRRSNLLTRYRNKLFGLCGKPWGGPFTHCVKHYLFWAAIASQGTFCDWNGKSQFLFLLLCSNLSNPALSIVAYSAVCEARLDKSKPKSRKEFSCFIRRP